VPFCCYLDAVRRNLLTSKGSDFEIANAIKVHIRNVPDRNGRRAERAARAAEKKATEAAGKNAAVAVGKKAAGVAGNNTSCKSILLDLTDCFRLSPIQDDSGSDNEAVPSKITAHPSLQSSSPFDL